MPHTPHPRVALIGASGWLGRWIGPALLRKGVLEPAALICANRSGRSPAYADWPDLAWEIGAAAAIAQAEIVVLSVRPEEFREAEFACEGRLAISLMAGVSCAETLRRTGARAVVRAMPNAAVEIERSYSPWFASDGADEDDRRRVRALLAAVGGEDELDREADLDIVTALCGAGPAYPALLASALLKAATAAGLSPRVAERAVEAVVCDASGLLRGQAKNAEALVKAFIDYRGTTAEALSAARDGGFDASIAAALAAAAEKARRLSD